MLLSHEKGRKGLRNNGEISKGLTTHLSWVVPLLLFLIPQVLVVTFLTALTKYSKKSSLKFDCGSQLEGRHNSRNMRYLIPLHPQ